MSRTLSSNSLCYEAIQIVFRRAVVEHIRTRFKAEFGTDWERYVRKPFQLEWDAIVEAARESRASGQLSTTVADDADMLGVNHFYNLFEANLDLLFPPAAGQTKADRKREREAILRWAKTIKELRDPLSHPNDASFPYEDAFTLIDSARRLVLKIDANAADKLRQLSKQIHDDDEEIPETAGELQGLLPPRVNLAIDFVGRAEELAALNRWFADPEGRQWVLAGDGGKGKTAIAYQFATAIKHRAPKGFDAVIWLSAKRRQFVSGRIQQILTPDFRDIDDALDTIIKFYGEEVDPSDTRESKKRRVLQRLREYPALIVADDIDSVEDTDPARYFFAIEIPFNSGSRVLLTSRRELFGLEPVTTQISGFRGIDGERFVESRIQLMQLDANAFTPDVTEAILSATDGSPLYIEDLLRLCKTGEPPHQAIKIWRDQGGGDLARQYALKREFEQLSTDAQQVLLVCAMRSGPVSLVEIADITGFADHRVRAGVGELQRLFLVPKPRLVEDQPRFEINANTAELVKQALAKSDIYRQVESGIQAVLGSIPKVERRDPDVQDRVRQALFLARHAQFSDAEQLLVTGLDDKPNDATLYGFLGWLYNKWVPRRFTDARAAFRRAASLKNRNPEMYWHWAMMEADQGELTTAAEAADKGLQRVPNSRDLLYLSGFVRSRLSRELRGALQIDRAKDEASRAIADLEKAVQPAAGRDALEVELLPKAYRALVLADEIAVRVEDPDYAIHWGRTDEIEAERIRERRLHAIQRLYRHLEDWRQAAPADPRLTTESARLKSLYPLPLFA